MTSHGTSIASLGARIAQDLAASNALSTRINQLRADIAAGIPLPAKKVDLMERSNKDMVKDLIARLDKIENLGAKKTATDRELEQALNARLCVCDLHVQRLAELRDEEFSARMTKDFLEPEIAGKASLGKRKAKEPAKAAEEPVLEAVLQPNESTQSEHEEEPVEEVVVGSRAHEDEDEDADDQDRYPEEPEPDKSEWPLLYRILDVSPDLWFTDFQVAARL
jgi:hypothetical protein